MRLTQLTQPVSKRSTKIQASRAKRVEFMGALETCSPCSMESLFPDAGKPNASRTNFSWLGSLMLSKTDRMTLYAVFLLEPKFRI